MRRLLLWTAAWAVLPAPPLTAEEPVPRGRVEIGGGLVLAGGYSIGASAANITRNPDGGSLTLFETSTALRGSTGLGGRIALRAARRLYVEGEVSHDSATLSTIVSRDSESPPPVTLLVGDLPQLRVEGRLRLHLDRFAFREKRASPFLVAGAGYLRQTGGEVFLATGTTYHAGAGLQYRAWSQSKGWLKGVAFRADGRAYLRTGGLDYEDKARWSVLAALSVDLILF